MSKRRKSKCSKMYFCEYAEHLTDWSYREIDKRALDDLKIGDIVILNNFIV